MFEVHGVIFSRELIFNSKISTHRINRYPAIGSPCLHPLPTFILGVGIPFIITTDSKFFKRVVIQSIVNWLKLNSFRVFCINSNDIESKAFEKSICIIIPGMFDALALKKRSKVFRVTSPIYLFGS